MKYNLEIKKSPLLLTMGSILRGGPDWNILTVTFPTLASRLISLKKLHFIKFRYKHTIKF